MGEGVFCVFCFEVSINNFVLVFSVELIEQVSGCFGKRVVKVCDCLIGFFRQQFYYDGIFSLGEI